MMRALASHQFGPGLNPRVDAMWVEFIVGSCSCFKGFLLVSQVFFPPQKPTFLNSNSTWKQWVESNSVDMPLQIPIYLFIYLFYYLPMPHLHQKENILLYLIMCSSRKYPYSPHKRFFVLHPLPPGNSGLFSYIASKNFTFKTPLPLGISTDLPWGGYGFFLEPHNYYWYTCGINKLYTCSFNKKMYK